jgi:hypothetical protein
LKDWLTKEAVSGLAKRATDILFMQSPIATAMGVMGGFFLEAVANASRPLWENSKVINLANIGTYSYVFSGIFICNIVALLFSLRRRKGFSQQIEKGLAIIKRAKKEGKLSDSQIRLLYINLIEKVLQSVKRPTLPKAKKPTRRRRPSSD